MKLTTRFANPAYFMRLATPLAPWLGLGALLTFAYGLYLSLYMSPADYQQGETVRIMYIHVPAAWVSLMLYAAMAVAAGVGLVARHALTDVFCVAAAPVGAVLVALCLMTGSIWGKPTWGTWWVWDARLTSVLVLFLLYCGYIVLRQAFDDHERGSRAAGILLLTGVVNIPIVRFSVDWWHTLHQPASIMRPGGNAIAPEMLKPLLMMALAYALFTAYLILLRMQSVMIARRIEAAAMMEAEDC
ncbi:MAG: heme ABC transporter permease [Alphaproteobacteria bacterium]|nr:heme ABC transporter permease [Alphaproteobacteria bacterium]